MNYYRIGDLPRDMREDLFNLHAVGTNPSARERIFYCKRVPLGELKITAEILVSPIPLEVLQPYIDLDPRAMPPLVVCDGKLLDGQHRISAARVRGIICLPCIDVTGLVDTKVTGFISTIPSNSISFS